MNSGKFTPGLVLVLAGIVLGTIACEHIADFRVDIAESTPTSFLFGGRSAIADFEIWDVPRTTPLSKTNPFDAKGETIWKISPAAELVGRAWPNVTYGVVPNGFSQSIPLSGLPPPLSESKLYLARISDGRDSNSAIFFEIRNGRTVNVTDRVFGR